MMPRHLRARERVTQEDMAARLGMSILDLRSLEACSLDLWDVATLGRYVEALGCRVRIIAERDGKGEELAP